MPERRRHSVVSHTNDTDLSSQPTATGRKWQPRSRRDWDRKPTMASTIDQSANVELTDDHIESGSKGKLIKLAGKLRDRRNELNQQASERADKRDELNAKTREQVDLAQEHREQRDELNEKVQEHKQKRNELNAKANELFDEVDDMKGDLDLEDGKDLDTLESEIEDLEFRQQTEVLSSEDERELIEKIEDKREQYQERQDALDDTEGLEEVKAEAEEVRAEASEHHEKVTELADEAQDHHNEMISAYREADDVRDE